jgi:uncharacterized damage-inducible protein DinB
MPSSEAARKGAVRIGTETASMTLTEARELFAYNKWANDQMLASLAGATPEHLCRDLACSFPTILATAAHIAAAEWVWLSRWTGAHPTAMPDWAASPELDGITRKFAELEHERAEYISTLAEQDLERSVPYTLFSGAHDTQPLRALFQHVVNHGTYHRGQVAAMLRQVGAEPKSTDIIRWRRER